MTTGVMVAVLLAAALHAGWNALVKGRGADPLTSSFGLSVVWAAVAGPLLAVVPPLDPAAVPFLAVSVCVHLLYFSLLVAAYRTGELSVVYPIARGTPPMLIALVAAAFGEPLGLAGALGVGAITLGVLVLTPPPSGVRRGVGAPVALALGSAGCTAVYTLVDGYGTRLAGGPGVYLTWLTAIQGGRSRWGHWAGAGAASSPTPGPTGASRSARPGCRCSGTGWRCGR